MIETQVASHSHHKCAGNTCKHVSLWSYVRISWGVPLAEELLCATLNFTHNAWMFSRMFVDALFWSPSSHWQSVRVVRSNIWHHPLSIFCCYKSHTVIYLLVVLICIFHITNPFESPFISTTVDAWCTSQIPAPRPGPLLSLLPGVLAADTVQPSSAISLSQRKLLHPRLWTLLGGSSHSMISQHRKIKLTNPLA